MACSSSASVSPKTTVIRNYPDGARILEFEGTQFAVQPDGRISWMSDWGKQAEWQQRGLVTEQCYGPATYNHVSVFWREGLDPATPHLPARRWHDEGEWRALVRAESGADERTL
jgi:hypothetical protein